VFPFFGNFIHVNSRYRVIDIVENFVRIFYEYSSARVHRARRSPSHGVRGTLLYGARRSSGNPRSTNPKARQINRAKRKRDKFDLSPRSIIFPLRKNKTAYSNGTIRVWSVIYCRRAKYLPPSWRIVWIRRVVCDPRGGYALRSGAKFRGEKQFVFFDTVVNSRAYEGILTRFVGDL